MKTLRLHTLALGAVISLAGTVAAQESAAPPVEFPGLDHFAPLWERSIFTTKDLPAPEADAGPNFADNFGLSGLYEIDGAVVALIVDKTTSLVHTTKIGSENELGIQIRKIAGEVTDSKVRVQLQKGGQVGWVGSSDGSEAGPPPQPVAAGGVSRALPTRAEPDKTSLLLPLPSSPAPGAVTAPQVRQGTPSAPPLPPSGVEGLPLPPP